MTMMMIIGVNGIEYLDPKVFMAIVRSNMLGGYWISCYLDKSMT